MLQMLKVFVIIAILLTSAFWVFYICLKPENRRLATLSDLAIFIAIPAIGLFVSNKNVFYGFLFLIPLFWFADPTRLAKRYVLALLSFPELAENFTLGSVYLGGWSAIFFLNAGALLALAITRRGRSKPVRSVDAAMWLIFLVSLLIFARGVPLAGTIRFVATTFLLILPPYFVISQSTKSVDTLKEVLSSIVLGGVCNVSISLFESGRSWSLYENIYTTLHVRIGGPGANSAIRAGLLRAGGTFVNYETLGLVCGTALITTLVLARIFTKSGFYTVIILLTSALVLSQARSAWIATLIGITFQAAYDRRWRRLGALTIGGSVAAFLSKMLSNQGRLGQLLGRSGHAKSTEQYRQALLDKGIAEARTHPLTGQTLDQLQVSMNDMRQGDHIIDFVNTHLLVVLVGGIGALSLWLFSWVIPLVEGWRRRSARTANIPISLPFSLISMTFVFLTFTSPVDRMLSLVAIDMGLMSVVIQLSMHDRKGHSVSNGRQVVAIG